VAVDQLTFDVPEGQVLGFLGPNGAGKSTTMKMITGFLAPSSGQIRVAGFDVESDPVSAKSVIGYLPEGAPGYGEMTPSQFLNFIADARGLTGDHRRKRIQTVVDQLHMSKVIHQSLETLSKGFRRRVGLAQALLHDPAVLILDEPTDGLDPNQKHEVRQLISDLAEDKIVIVSTHILEEVEAVCDRAIIIAQGKLLADDTPDALCAKSHYHQAIRLSMPEAASLLPIIEPLDGVSRVDVLDEGRQLMIVPHPGVALYRQISALIEEHHWPIDGFSVERGRLDEVFRQITGEVAT